MVVTAELVIESDRTSTLRAPEAAGSEVILLNPNPADAGKVESYSLPPDQFHEMGPILKRLGVRVTERGPNFLERMRSLVSSPDRRSLTRAVAFASN